MQRYGPVDTRYCKRWSAISPSGQITISEPSVSPSSNSVRISQQQPQTRSLDAAPWACGYTLKLEMVYFISNKQFYTYLSEKPTGAAIGCIAMAL